MSAFALTPRIPVVEPAGDFPTGIQFQENEVDVGPPNPENVSFDNDFTLSYDSATGTVHIESTGSGSGGPAPSVNLIAVSASLTADQTSGSTLICDNVSTNGGNAYAGYNPDTGVLTVQAGDGGMWAWGGHAEMVAGNEAAGETRELIAVRNGGDYGTSNPVIFEAGEQWNINVDSGMVRLADGDQIRVDVNVAFAIGTSGVRANGTTATRFWAMRIAD